MDATEPLGPAQLRPAATLTDDVDGELESMGGKLRADPVLARLSQVAPQREATTDSPAVDESLLLVWEESTFGSSSSEAIPPVTDSVEPVQPNPPAAPTRPDADETDDGDSGDGDSGDGDSSPMGPFFFED